MLRLSDDDLIAVLKTLSECERRIIEACVQKGLRSDQARAAIRKFRARLKARARREKRAVGAPDAKETRHEEAN